jgi:hypothetical protein
MLKIDEEREKIFSRTSASSEAQLAASIHELLEVMASNKSAKDKKYKVSKILGEINDQADDDIGKGKDHGPKDMDGDGDIDEDDWELDHNDLDHEGKPKKKKKKKKKRAAKDRDDDDDDDMINNQTAKLAT